jgi:hypothetical protein
VIAVAYADLGAVRSYDKALKIDPNDAWLGGTRADILLSPK